MRIRKGWSKVVLSHLLHTTLGNIRDVLTIRKTLPSVHEDAT